MRNVSRGKNQANDDNGDGSALSTTPTCRPVDNNLVDNGRHHPASVPCRSGKSVAEGRSSNNRRFKSSARKGPTCKLYKIKRNAENKMIHSVEVTATPLVCQRAVMERRRLVKKYGGNINLPVVSNTLVTKTINRQYIFTCGSSRY